ncbi:hypothetical protein Afil01_32760 [Actinorhabdospora filicis]|uniref:Uncharacterized protein n=1 Tax=Actinorhabdospora filicis TaxID=1785913 RepID=A0A9W6W9C6_9ACTN|nr:hypothetical protein [Actinorhabdospora filicis]GLZ78469.1 hypothetical protein Afil01_32760 [Actinorhabdospora filicis]
MTTLTKVPQTTSRRPNLERQALLFTIGLYLFICVALLAVHYAAPDEEPAESGSSSTSPYNP